jgi:large subunit ribosomal protein L29
MAKEQLDIAGMSEAELRSNLASLENEYQQMKFDHAVKGLANPMDIRGMRKEIARFHTEARSREIAAMTPEQLENRSKLRARRRRQK